MGVKVAIADKAGNALGIGGFPLQVAETGGLPEYEERLDSGLGDGTYDVNFRVYGSRYASWQVVNTAGGAGTNTYTIWATSDAESAPLDCTYVDVTADWTGAANFTASKMVEIDTPLSVANVRIRIVRSADGGALDGGYTIHHIRRN